MAAAIPQPFTCYLPPCLETLYREGASFGKEDTKHALSCIALYYQIQARKADPPIDDDGYSLIPMLQYINGLSHEKLSDEEIELLAEDVRSTSRKKITCKEFKKSDTLKNCCVSEDCKLSDGSKSDDPSTKKAADRIMERGDVLKFTVRQVQKNHIGDTDVIKHLLASAASTNSLTSAGIQPELNGEKGHGKTDAVKATFHIIPEKWKLSASISAKALYYHQGLLPGSILFSDDVQWSEDLISTVKRSMGSFQEPQTHFTLDAQRNPLPHTMPPRLVWWLSSVESVADDQLKDRQYSLDIDEEAAHSEKVSDYLRISRSQKRVRFSVDKGIEIAREIISQIKEHEPFKVVIDCAEFADWKVKEDHRTQNKFWDLVEAFAILRFKQRVIDEDGWLHATTEDFNEAKTIFMRRKANHATHLTNAQTKIVKSVIALQNDSDGATQATIAKDLGIRQPAVSKGLKAIMANTRYIISRPGVHGETFYECTVCALEVCYAEGDLVSLPEGYKDPYSSIFHRYSTVIPNLIPTENTNSNYNQSSIFPVIEEYSKGDNHEGKDVSNPCRAPENRNNGINPSPDSESYRNNDGISIGIAVLRFLQPIPAFMGEDMRKYGPFQIEDVATVPSLNAKGLLEKGAAVEVHPAMQPVSEGEDDNPSPALGKIDRPTPARKEDPGFTKFKRNMAKRQCCLCGKKFPYDLTPYYNNGVSGYICSSCHMGGAPSVPIKADPQTSLADVQAT